MCGMCVSPGESIKQKVVRKQTTGPHKMREFSLDPTSITHDGHVINFKETCELWTTDDDCECCETKEFQEKVDQRVAELASYHVTKGWKRVNSGDGKCYAIVRVERTEE